MRGLLRLAAALAVLAGGAVAGCFQDDFLLGALCTRDDVCGDDACCDGRRCRPRCDREVGIDGAQEPYKYAYMTCDEDDECLVHGLQRCARWDGAARGFCTDLCISDQTNCERHPEYFVGAPLPRTCVTIEEQSLCALDCMTTNICPEAMTCRSGVCAPRDP
jgi:hypothetical protein